MKISEIPKNEIERLAAIHRYHILDSEDEKDFDDIAELASQICNVPIAIITLVDEKRQWFKAKRGLTIKETHRNLSFCAHTILGDDLLIVSDALNDERFYDNPLVTAEPHIRFYAGAPLVTDDGYKLGSLAVLDERPRILSPGEIAGLKILAKQVMNLLNLRYNILQLQEKNAEVSYLAHLVEQTGDAIISVDENFIIKTWNSGSQNLFGYSKEEAIGNFLQAIIRSQRSDDEAKAISKILRERRVLRGEAVYLHRTGSLINALVSISVLHGAGGERIGYVFQLRNISERKKLEDNLKIINDTLKEKIEEKTAEIREVFERVSDAFIAVDKRWHYTYVNKKAGQLFNRPPESLVGKNFWTEFPEFVDEPFSKVYEEAMQLQQYKYIENYHASFKLWFETHIYPSPTGLSMYFRDISDKKEAELAIETSEKIRRLIMNSALDAIVCSNPNGVITLWNNQAEKLFGWTEAEILGRQIIDTIVPERYRERHQEGLKRYLKTGEGHLLNRFTEISAINKRNEEFPIELTIVAIKEGGDEFFCAFIRDITQRKLAEEEAFKANERFKLVARATNDVVWDWDLENNELWWNENFYSLFGYEKESKYNIASKYEAIHPEDRNNVVSEIDRIIASDKQFWSAEYKFLKADGSYLYIYDRGYIIPQKDGKPVRMIGAMTDITERKTAEERLKAQFEQLKKTNFELDKFVYSVSHDLRAPLMSILGVVNVAELEPLTASQKKYAEMIKSSVTRLDVFIRDILDYSRNARGELRIDRIDFRELLKTVFDNLKFMSDVDRINLNTIIDDDIPFYSDELRITIILNNLLSNAIMYQDLKKEKSFVSITISIESNKAIIKITDNGIGIDPKALDKIFDMFYRASTLSRGSGLGLYIVKEALNKLQGSIIVESKIKEYTSFEIVVPNLQGKS